MYCPPIEPDDTGVTTAVATFAHSLSALGLAARVVRLETRVHSSGSADVLFAVDATMIAAWPGEVEARPQHEFVLIAEPKATTDWIEMRAFDAEGRALLNRRYANERGPAGAPRLGDSAHA